MPKVSVLIPIYNSEKYLDKCIQSVISQTLSDIEIILINDGSLDDSENIINKYKSDTRIEIITEQNSGYGVCLNKAINIAKAQYIFILESDDFINKDILEKLYAHAKYDIVKASFNFYPDNIRYKLNIDGLYSIDDKPEMINVKPSIWSSIYRKDFLIENNIKFNESKGASYQDISFHFKALFCAKNIYFLDEPLYNYRTDSNSSSTKAKNKVQAIINEFSIIDEYLKDKVILPETNNQLILFELRAYIWNFYQISKFYKNEFINLSNKKFKSKNLNDFYSSRYITFKDKIKVFLLVNYPNVFKNILSTVKKVNIYK